MRLLILSIWIAAVHAYAEAPPGMRPSPVSYTGTLLTPSPTIQQHTLDLSAPLWRGTKDMVLISTRNGYRSSDTSVVLDNGVALPRTFWNTEVGLGWVRRRENGHTLSLRASVGSASDRLFSGSRSTTILGTASYLFPDGEFSKWMIGLFFTNNSAFLPPIPIPGFSYTYTPSPRFMLSVGIPFIFLRWMFYRDWKLEIASIGPTNARGELTTAVYGDLRLGLAFLWSQQLYLRLGRLKDEDRLFFDDKRLGLSIRHPLGERLELELQTGYAFDRSVFESRTYFRKATATARLPAGWYASGQLRLVVGPN